MGGKNYCLKEDRWQDFLPGAPFSKWGENHCSGKLELFFLHFARLCFKMKIVDFFARFFWGKSDFGQKYLSILEKPATFFVSKNT
jgi:hypothetical protein